MDHQQRVYLRFNSDEGSFEGYDGSAWGSIGGGASAGGAIYENTDDITANYTITTGSQWILSGSDDNRIGRFSDCSFWTTMGGTIICQSI
jgi:hypothetical protein